MSAFCRHGLFLPGAEKLKDLKRCGDTTGEFRGE